MTNLIIVFVCCYLYSFLRTGNTKSTIDSNYIKGSIELAILQILWLVSTSLGVSEFLNGDKIITGLVYVSSAVLGYISNLKLNELMNGYKFKFKIFRK